jgi:penicillin G amidase
MYAKWLALFVPLLVHAEQVKVAGLEKPVEILRDRWGVPHIYASTTNDLFFAQGYITAADRLFQIDLWRRTGTGKLAEVLGAKAVARDRLARLVRFRGDWDTEWRSYSPDARQIAVSFTAGINAYIRSLGGRRPIDFQFAGYDPGLWAPEDVTARVAGLLMTRNLNTEVTRSIDARRFGLAALQKLRPPDPPVELQLPKGLDLADISADITRDYAEAIGPVRFAEQGSNNWVVDGTMSVTGKPLLANDPHRPVQIPSLRKIVHLVAPGWNAIGAGEPALPGIAVGHNEEAAFGFTIVGIDQQDLYVEKLNPANDAEYLYRGAWKKMEIERQTLAVKGESSPHAIELRYTIHGPVIYEDRSRHRAYALRWVGAEPGGAGYLPALSLARAKNWSDFQAAVARYKVPSENLVYADRAGNIGWIAAGYSPIRKNWTGLFPVPGDSGEFEWNGFLPTAEMPQTYNPQRHWIATANHKILPDKYPHQLGYEFALPFRYQRIAEMLTEKPKYSVADFERMQQDVTSIPARRFQRILKNWTPPNVESARVVKAILDWDARMTADSMPALVFEAWIARLSNGMNIDLTLSKLESTPDPGALTESLREALADVRQLAGPDVANWQWGRVHQIHFRHPLGNEKFDLAPVARPGDANTVNATSGANFRQTNGASYRQILDVADWDRSVMTNVPGEVGNPESPHYRDLLDDWAAGRYHPMPYSRKAVEAATVDRINLLPN